MKKPKTKPVAAPAAPVPPTSDVGVQDHGSVIAFSLKSEAAQSWVDENVDAESWQFLGRRLVVDSRFADNLIAGMQGDGLTLEAEARHG